MKRNLDLIRYILLTTEDSDTSELRVADYITSQYSFNEVSYHITLLIEAGYLLLEQITSVHRIPITLSKDLHIKGMIF